MQLKFTSVSSAARSFIVVAAMCAASLFCASSACAQTTSGFVTAWGSNQNGPCTIPASASSVTAIAGGNAHTIALQGGAVLAWGNNADGACTVPASASSGVSAIAGGGYHTIALKNGADIGLMLVSYGPCAQ